MDLTKNQKRILNLFTERKLLTAADITDSITNLDRATIFRNLAKLVDERILSLTSVKKGTSSYELIGIEHKHLHFICTNCEKIIHIDIKPDSFSKLFDEKVLVEDMDLSLKGKCEHCR